jgi:hypothetical protein
LANSVAIVAIHEPYRPSESDFGGVCTQSPVRPAAERPKPNELTPEGFIGCLVIGLVLLVVCGLCSMCAKTPEPTTPYQYSDPYKYNDATDRHLKNLPSMRGFSDREKERIIEEAKKFQEKVDALERSRGY